MITLPTNTTENLTHDKETGGVDCGLQCVNNVSSGGRLLHFNKTSDGAKLVALFNEISGARKELA